MWLSRVSLSYGKAAAQDCLFGGHEASVRFAVVVPALGGLYTQGFRVRESVTRTHTRDKKCMFRWRPSKPTNPGGCGKLTSQDINT